MGKLHLGDCLDLLPTIKAHLIVADPPYALSKMESGWSASDARRTTKGQVVTNLSAGMAFHKDQAIKAGHAFAPFAAAIGEALVDGGFVALFASPRLSHGFASALERVDLAIRDAMVWLHGGGQFKAASLVRFGVDREHRTPQPRPMFEAILLAQKLPRGTLAKCWQAHGTGLMRARTLDGAIPSNLLSFPKPSADERRDGGRHPTQKPTALMAELVHRFSLPGQVIVDPFMGSGATGVAAVRLGREFHGAERDPTYFTIASERIAHAALSNEGNG